MKRWQRALVTAGVVGLGGILAARYGWFRRVRFPDHWRMQVLDNPEHPHHLAFVHLRQGHERLVIVAHGALQSMNQPGIARLARVLQERFDVILFDFRGHGRSGGVSDLNFLHAAEDLRRMIAYARQQGYRRIGLWGYSMGAAAALLAAAQGEAVEAIVCICCPVKPSQRNTRSFALSTRLWGWLVRLVRTRLAPRLYWGEWPIEYVDQVAPAPLLIVHHGLDTLVPREDSETLFALARAPKDFLYLPWALHGQVMAAAMPALAWLEAKMPLSQAERASRAEEKKGAQSWNGWC